MAYLYCYITKLLNLNSEQFSLGQFSPVEAESEGLVVSGEVGEAPVGSWGSSHAPPGEPLLVPERPPLPRHLLPPLPRHPRLPARRGRSGDRGTEGEHPAALVPAHARQARDRLSGLQLETVADNLLIGVSWG